MKKLFFAFSLLVAGLQLCCAQTVVLNWDGAKAVDYNFTKKVFPFFKNDGYSADGANVYVTTNTKITESVRPSNYKWEEVSATELNDMRPELLPEDEQFWVNGGISEPKTITVAAYRRAGTRFYRLLSFDIIPEVSSGKQFITRKMPMQKSPFANGNFYKIKVDKSGIFKITKKFLRECGINPDAVDPRNLRVYGNGGTMLPENNNDFRYGVPQENAIKVTGESDGKWDDTDYALFYAIGPNGFNLYKNKYNSDGYTDGRIDKSMHVTNIYEDYAYYFLTFDLGAGKRVEDQKIPSAGKLITKYDEYQFLDEEKINITKVGRLWTGDAIQSQRTVEFKTRTPLVPTDTLYYRVSAAGYNAQKTSLLFSINSQNKYTIPVPPSADGMSKYTYYTGQMQNISGNTISISLIPDYSANPSGQFFFDYAEILYKQDLKYNGAQMNFRNYNISETGENSTFSLSDISGMEAVWNVSDQVNATNMVNNTPGSNFTFGYKASSRRFKNEFVAFKNDAAYLPVFVSKVDNQNLQDVQATDYLIIAPKQFYTDAERLATFHKNKEKFKVAIITPEQIYNEYSSGGQDITAIRDFITDLKEVRGGLKYVLLLGDTSYDYKNRIPGNENIIPSYESEASSDYATSYVTDDYFVMTAPQNASDLKFLLPDLPIGRLPAANAAEAKLLIDKTLAYDNALSGQSTPFGDWRLKLDFVVDDDNDGGKPFHTDMDEVINKNFESGFRTEYNVKKLYLDAFVQQSTAGGQRYPQVNSAITNDMSNSLFMFYFGHGGINGWAQERVLTLEDIKNFNNYNNVFTRFPLMSTITCEFTLWDVPEIRSAGEQVIKLKTGGSAIMITSSRAIAVDYGRLFTDNFIENIFTLTPDNKFRPIGDAHLAAKNSYRADINHLRVNYLGDPATVLARPTPYIKIDKIESPDDTKLRALDFVKITGHILTESGTPDTSFTGRVSLNIYDKRVDKSTRNNDGNLTPVKKYSEEGVAIVKTAAQVNSGNFVIEFYVPKDIDYKPGEGRMSFYADNFSTAKSAAHDVYNSQKINIGGINPDGLKDNSPPKVQLFLNNTSFADGGITNPNPTLLACLSDDTGINSTGAGIGHDITAVLDGQVISTTLLNDFFSAGEGNGCTAVGADYQKGSVSYPFRNLAPGKHQIVFKVWDINNNSTTATLNFIVKSEADQSIVINRLLNWPNPFTDKTYLQFEHNCDDILEVHAQIYTIAGRLVRSINQTVISDKFLQGYRTPRTAIEWDGKDDYGSTVGKGTYIYKIYVKSSNQERCPGTATAVEKAVLLK